MAEEKPFKEFMLREADLVKHSDTKKALETYKAKKAAFVNGLKELNESKDTLEKLLDKPLRDKGLIEGEFWKLRENDDGDGLLVQVWESMRRRKKRTKKEIETVSFSFPGR